MEPPLLKQILIIISLSVVLVQSAAACPARAFEPQTWSSREDAPERWGARVEASQLVSLGRGGWWLPDTRAMHLNPHLFSINKNGHYAADFDGNAVFIVNLKTGASTLKPVMTGFGKPLLAYSAIAFDPTTPRIFALTTQGAKTLTIAAELVESQTAPLQLEDYQTGDYVNRVEVSADGKYLAAVMAKKKSDRDSGVLTIWDVATGKRIMRHEKASGDGFSFLPDDKFGFFSADRREVFTYDFKRRLISAFAEISGNAQNRYLNVIKAKTGGTYAFVERNAVSMWNFPDVERKIAKNFGDIETAAFSDDGKWLAIAESYGGEMDVKRKMRLFSAAQPEDERGVEVSVDIQESFASLQFSPTGEMLIAVTTAGDVQIWKVDDPRDSIVIEARNIVRIDPRIMDREAYHEGYGFNVVLSADLKYVQVLSSGARVAVVLTANEFFRKARRGLP